MKQYFIIENHTLGVLCDIKQSKLDGHDIPQFKVGLERSDPQVMRFYSPAEMQTMLDRIGVHVRGSYYVVMPAV